MRMTETEIQALSNRELYELFKELIYDEFLTYKDQVRKEVEHRLESWLAD